MLIAQQLTRHREEDAPWRRRGLCERISPHARTAGLSEASQRCTSSTVASLAFALQLHRPRGLLLANLAAEGVAATVRKSSSRRVKDVVPPIPVVDVLLVRGCMDACALLSYGARRCRQLPSSHGIAIVSGRLSNCMKRIRPWSRSASGQGRNNCSRLPRSRIANTAKAMSPWRSSAPDRHRLRRELASDWTIATCA